MTCKTLISLSDPTGRFSLVVEDDGHVAYAYLRDEGRIVGDVWLYNVDPAPDHTRWKDQQRRPFLNPQAFCSGRAMQRFSSDSDIQAIWDGSAVTLIVDGVPCARLSPGSKPGWSVLAARSGPLAKPLEELA
jgi:hypothetical protein